MLKVMKDVLDSQVSGVVLTSGSVLLAASKAGLGLIFRSPRELAEANAWLCSQAVRRLAAIRLLFSLGRKGLRLESGRARPILDQAGQGIRQAG
jgi:hypothetical protein